MLNYFNFTYIFPTKVCNRQGRDYFYRLVLFTFAELILPLFLLMWYFYCIFTIMLCGLVKFFYRCIVLSLFYRVRRQKNCGQSQGFFFSLSSILTGNESRKSWVNEKSFSLFWTFWDQIEFILKNISGIKEQ